MNLVPAANESLDSRQRYGRGRYKIRFTEKDGSLYIILDAKIQLRTVSIPLMPAKGWDDVHLLGFQKALTVTTVRFRAHHAS